MLGDQIRPRAREDTQIQPTRCFGQARLKSRELRKQFHGSPAGAVCMAGSATRALTEGPVEPAATFPLEWLWQ